MKRQRSISDSFIIIIFITVRILSLSFVFCLYSSVLWWRGCVVDEIRMKIVGNPGLHRRFVRKGCLQSFVKYPLTRNPLKIEAFTSIFLYPGQQQLALLSSIPGPKFQVSSGVDVSVWFPIGIGNKIQNYYYTVISSPQFQFSNCLLDTAIVYLNFP